MKTISSPVYGDNPLLHTAMVRYFRKVNKVRSETLREVLYLHGLSNLTYARNFTYGKSE